MLPKVVLLGSPGSGKTSFYLCAMQKVDFYSIGSAGAVAYSATLGANFATLEAVYDGNEVKSVAPPDTKRVGADPDRVRFGLWDTAGQERYKSLAPMYYRNAAVVLVMHECTMSSRKAAEGWIDEVRNLSPNTKIVVVQNKTDINPEINRSFIEAHKVDAWADSCTLRAGRESVQKVLQVVAALLRDKPALSIPESPALSPVVAERYSCSC